MLRTAVHAGALLLVLATAVSFIPSNEWWIRIFDFPRRQIAVLLVVAVGTTAVVDVRRWRSRLLLAAMVVALIAQVWRILPYTPLAGVEVTSRDPCAPDTRVRLLVANVEYANQDARAVIELIREVDPDIVLLFEPGAWWAFELRALEQDLPYVVGQPQEDTWGLLLYSRLELHEPEVRFLVDRDIPSVRARVRLASGQDVWLYGVHPRPPRPGDDTDERDTELMIVAREIRGHSRPAILAGDLNDVAWSRTTSRLRQTADLRDPRIGRGVYATFNANWPIGFRWPLDHVFVTPHFDLCVLERLPHVGSDHFPLLADVALRETPPR